MNYLGITSVGAYVPRLRLTRESIARANAWAIPGLLASAKGERAIANWDEDSITMAVEASREALRGKDASQVRAAYLASTALPFTDRQNAGILAAALRLSPSLSTLDIGGSQRAATSALIAALRQPGLDNVLVAASDHRRAKPGSSQEMQSGDGAAAVLLGQGEPLLRCIDVEQRAVDFVDHYRTPEDPYDYGWEERWIRDEGYGKIVPPAVNALLTRNGVQPADIAHFILACPLARVAASMAKDLGVPDKSVADDLSRTVGDTGAAHPLLMLASVVERARAGEKILLIGFGQGCDCLLFEATPALEKVRARTSVSGMLARGRKDENYLRFLSFNHEISLDWGKRAEVDNRTLLSAQNRASAAVLGFVGGKCTQTGTVEFPKSRVSVYPDARHVDTQVDYPLADEPARVMSFTTDWLSFKESPPFQYGQVQFDCGARILMEFADTDAGQLEVGMPLRMVFRVKDFDYRRGYRRYFWKAVPLQNWIQER